MNIVQGMNADIMLLVIGSLMLLGSFATTNSIRSSRFDHDLALVLLVVGALCIGEGFNIIDLSQIKDISQLKELLPSSNK